MCYFHLLTPPKTLPAFCSISPRCHKQRSRPTRPGRRERQTPREPRPRNNNYRTRAGLSRTQNEAPHFVTVRLLLVCLPGHTLPRESGLSVSHNLFGLIYAPQPCLEIATLLSNASSDLHLFSPHFEPVENVFPREHLRSSGASWFIANTSSEQISPLPRMYTPHFFPLVFFLQIARYRTRWRNFRYFQQQRSCPQPVISRTNIWWEIAWIKMYHALLIKSFTGYWSRSFFAPPSISFVHAAD